MFKEFLKPKSPQEKLREEYAKKMKKNSDPELSRRDFLKKAGIAAGGLAFGTGAMKRIAEIRKENSKSGVNNKNEDRAEIVETENKEEIFEPTEIQMEEDDWEMVKKIFHPSIYEEVKINEELITAITLYWINEYQGKRKAELEKAVSEMDKLEPFLSECFTRHDMPDRLKYLAIPESGWRMDAVSRSGAVGPYQFMPATAAEFNLDNPKDPLKSADACARLLKRLYAQSNDLDLALAGYNGIAGYYITECKKTGKRPRYQSEDNSGGDYLTFLEKRINKIRREILDSKKKAFTYKVRELDIKNSDGKVMGKRVESLEEIAKRYNVSPEDVIRWNTSQKKEKAKKWSRIKKEKSKFNIFKGKEIKIFFDNKNENRQIKFEEEARGFIENINYPPKFNAVMYCLGIEKSKYVENREKKKAESQT